ncbi:MAG: NmrA/HSCARG family protein [Phycisphaerae bacterium]|nr:NmrA/HSCARG family protein [Phycisphaerae bacterium]
MPESKMVFVCGVTGRQGGAVARALLRDKWQVRGLTRDPSKREARELQRLGVETVRGDMGDRDDLEQYMQGCHGVFSVQNFWECGTEDEIRQGRLVAAVAKDVGIDHLVYSSVGGADLRTGIPHFESKWEIEQYIADLHMAATILRPVFFFDNFCSPPLSDGINSGVLSLPMKSDKPLQMIATQDIGGLAAMAFSRPEQFKGKAIEIAGDELTMPETAKLLSASLNRPVRFQEMSMDAMASFSLDLAEMFVWFNETGYSANIEALRDLYPPLQDLRSWLSQPAFAERLSRAA